MSLKIIACAVRPKSWLKNVFIFIPLVFSLELFAPDKLFETIIAFIAFCFVSSAVYVFNDICDSEKDAVHPTKSSRPIASGAISKQKAVVFTLLLLASGLSISLLANLLTLVFIVAYLAVNLIYSLWLKQKPIFDCFCIAAGFILRVYTGGAASGEIVSEWLFLTVLAMSLFMAFGKRRGELVKVDSTATREVLLRYNLEFLSGMIFICAALAVTFYSLWAMSCGNGMIYTVPLILLMVSKYLLLVHDPNSHGDPTTVIFEDRILLITGGVYALLAIALLY